MRTSPIIFHIKSLLAETRVFVWIKKNAGFLCILLLCFVIDLYFFYSSGLSRSYNNNIAYVQFIQNFPAILSKPGIEPFFVTLSYLLAQLIHSSIWAIIILKNITIILQLWIFYKLVQYFIKNQFLTLLSLFFLNFSFAYFSLIDTLLRNHFANLLFLIAFYFLVKILSQKKAHWEELSYIIIPGGLLIYTHILPTLLFDFTILLLAIIFSGIILIRTFWNYSPWLLTSQELKNILSSLLLVGVFIFFLQLPYMVRLSNAHVNLGDYRAHTTQTYTTESEDSHIQNIPSQQKTLSLKTVSAVFRILFEFRLPGFTLFSMTLVAGGLWLSLRKLPTQVTLSPLIILWLITYFSSKIDLIFGIGTLPYRFSLMLIFPSLLFLLIFIDFLTQKIKSDAGKNFLSLIFLFVFLGINIPLIAETTILRNYQENNDREEGLRHFYQETIGTEAQVFLGNGISFEDFNSSSRFLRNESAFSTEDEAELIFLMEDNGIEYIIYDHNKIAETGSGLGTTLNTNLKTYQNSPHFQNLGEFVGSGFHFSLFQFIPHPTSPLENTSKKIIINCRQETPCQTELAKVVQKEKSPIQDWAIEVKDTGTVTINEFARLENHTLIQIGYQNSYTAQDPFSLSSFIGFYNFPERTKFHVPVNIFIESATVLLSTENILNVYSNLEQSSVNGLVINGHFQNHILSYAALTRTGLKLLVSLIVICALLLLYITYAILNKQKGNLFEVQSRGEKFLVFFFLLFSISDMLVLQLIFVEMYKYFFHV